MEVDIEKIANDLNRIIDETVDKNFSDKKEKDNGFKVNSDGTITASE